MGKLAGIAALLLGATALADKPAAVQICLELPHGVPLFSELAQRNYRGLPDGNYVLDLDIAMGGKEPQRIARSSANCLRAFIAAAPVREIRVAFDRTDLNLRPETHAVKLNLKEDLWFDGGVFEISRAPFSRVSTALPGNVELQRLESAEWAKGPLAIKDLAKVPSGRYRMRYEPPADQASCEFSLRVNASGTVSEESHPEQLAALVEAYRRDVAPEVAKKLQLTCEKGQSLEIELTVIDGVFLHPWNPHVERVTRFDQQQRYELVVDGARARFVSGEEVEIGFGQAIALEAQPDKQVASR